MSVSENLDPAARERGAWWERAAAAVEFERYRFTWNERPIWSGSSLDGLSRWLAAREQHAERVRSAA